MLKKYQPQLFFVAMLLVFDVAYSLLSTCQKVYPAAPQHGGPENHCTAFGGVIPWVGGIILHPLHHFLEAYEHALIAGFTIVLAFATGMLWWSTSKLWQAGKEQLEFTRNAAAVQSEDMKASIAVAKESADAARDSVKLAEDTAQRQLRAYVGIEFAVVLLNSLKTGKSRRGLDSKTSAQPLPTKQGLGLNSIEVRQRAGHSRMLPSLKMKAPSRRVESSM
jgi:hypothetical protein